MDITDYRKLEFKLSGLFVKAFAIYKFLFTFGMWSFMLSNIFLYFYIRNFVFCKRLAKNNVDDFSILLKYFRILGDPKLIYYLCDCKDSFAMAGLYVHIPFCRSKCAYCAFYSIVPRKDAVPLFVDALLAEARSRRSELRNIDTLYIGGGTPSLLPSAQWNKLTAGIRSLLSDSRIKEFTVEVNPDDVTPELVETWIESGVNRVSMGVQSFSESSLRFLGRIHSVSKAEEAYRQISRVGNVSIDLIYGHFGQTADQWREELHRLIDLSPQHLSAYSLTIEENSILARRASGGQPVEVDDEHHREMYMILCDEMQRAGYEHYELSSFAKPGYRSAHNSMYWTGERYTGLGPAASGYDGQRTRRTNEASLAKYLAAFSSEGKGVAPHILETLDDEELFEELVMTRLRVREGLRLSDLEKRFGRNKLSTLIRNAAQHIRAGRLQEKDGAFILTKEGMFVSDAVIVDLIS